jgi:hypothetical protein
MSLKDRIAGDLKLAMKAGDKIRLETLRTLRAGLMEKEIECRGKGSSMSEQEEIGVIAQAAKRRKESIDLFRQGNRQDLVDQEEEELRIIQTYLPAMMGEDEIRTVVANIIAESGTSGPSGFAKVMPLVMKELKGKADGKLVQQIVRKNLGMD